MISKRTAAQLSGCVDEVRFATKQRAGVAVAQLVSCNQHSGAHHFAVVGEGRTLAISTTAFECLTNAGLLP